MQKAGRQEVGGLSCLPVKLPMSVSRVESNTQATYGICRSDWEDDEFQKSKRKVGLDDVF